MSELEALLRFAGEAVLGTRGVNLGNDFHGGDCEEGLVRAGILDHKQVTESCGEGCACADYGFPTECYPLTELGKRAVTLARAVPSSPALDGSETP